MNAHYAPQTSNPRNIIFFIREGLQSIMFKLSVYLPRKILVHWPLPALLNKVVLTTAFEFSF